MAHQRVRGRSGRAAPADLVRKRGETRQLRSARAALVVDGVAADGVALLLVPIEPAEPAVLGVAAASVLLDVPAVAGVAGVAAVLD